MFWHGTGSENLYLSSPSIMKTKIAIISVAFLGYASSAFAEPSPIPVPSAGLGIITTGILGLLVFGRRKHLSR